MPEPEEQIVSDAYIGTDAAGLLREDVQGGSISGGGGADTTTGSDKNDDFSGGRGNDLIIAESDVLAGDADEVMEGDVGAAVFFATDDEDSDLEYIPITDFEPEKTP